MPTPISTRTRTDRLLALANHMRGLKAEQLDMDVWACGAAACAVGHACSIPEFQEAGLTLVPMNDSQDEMGLTLETDGMRAASNWEAVQQFFGIDRPTANFLFDGDMYSQVPTPQDVAERLSNYVHSLAA